MIQLIMILWPVQRWSMLGVIHNLEWKDLNEKYQNYFYPSHEIERQAVAVYIKGFEARVNCQDCFGSRHLCYFSGPLPTSDGSIKTI